VSGTARNDLIWEQLM